MNKNKVLFKLLSLFIAVLLLLSFTFQVLGAESVNTSDNYNYKKAGSPYNKTADSAQILETMIGEKLSESERSYLVAYGNIKVEYEDGITTAKISAVLTGGSLSVSAFRYSYISESGAEIVWVPKTASLGNEEKTLVKKDDSYTAVFEGVTEESGIAQVDILYTTSVIITEKDAKALLNKAKNDIPLLEEEIALKTDEYNRALTEYNAAKEKYLKFLEEEALYRENLEKYESYIIAYRIYSEKLEAYNEYLADKEIYDAAFELRSRYEKDLLEYKKNYADYINYITAKKTYDEDLAAYNTYIEKVGKFRDRIAIINYAEIKMTDLNRSALLAINGTVVTSVLEERDSLENKLVGAPPQVITLAGEATDRLRILFKDYFSYTTEEGRYGYYLLHYNEFKESFVNLFISLDHLYKNSSVRAALYETDRDEKYRILVAQLYLIAHALSDEPIKSVPKSMVEGSKDADKYSQFTYTSSYTIDTLFKYTVSEVLYGAELLVDKNSAAPINEPFPAEVKEPILPEKVDEPIEPSYVAPPLELEVAEDPGEPPKTVEDPGEPPKTAEDPGEPPEEYVPPSEYLSLIADKDSLSTRVPDFRGNYNLKLEKTVTKKFIGQEEVNVKFYSENGTALLYETTVDLGTSVGFEGVIPTKNEDAGAAYSFGGWKNSQGELISLDSVLSDLILYPHFNATVKSYKVTFDINGEKHEQTVLYGTVPEFSGELPSVQYIGDHIYTFSGWDRDLSAIEGDSLYTAVFDRTYIAPSSQGGASVTVADGELVLDYGITMDRKLDISSALSIAEKAGGLKIVSPYLTVSFSYSQLKALSSSEGAAILIEVSESVGSYYKYNVGIFNREGNAVGEELSFEVLDRYASLPENDRLKLFSFDTEGNRRYTKYQLTEQGLSFNAISGREYTFAYEYTVNAAAGSGATVALPKPFYSVGENVEMDLYIPDNMKLVRLYYTDKNGDTVELTTSSFRMPEYDIKLVAEIEFIKYKITFVSEGYVISSSYCLKGEMPQEPETPLKPSDGVNNFEFVGWSEEVTAAEADKTYRAVFGSSPIEEAEEVNKGLTLYQKAVLTVAVVGGVLLLLIAIGIGIKLGG